MDICGKGATFLGMMMVSIISQLTAGRTYQIFGMELQNENVAVGSLLLNFLLGYILFTKADKLNHKRIQESFQ